MKILSPTKTEKLSISDYISLIRSNPSQNIIKIKYEVNHDWSSDEIGGFVVEYDRLVLREKSF